jgi:hypothetical protein
MRALSERFMDDLLNFDGFLHPMLERVKHDQTLMLAIRQDCINIYYRGGNILKVTEQGKTSYRAFFDIRYDKSEEPAPVPPLEIKSQTDAQAWVDSFARLKTIMDSYFSSFSKPEREFQQLVARENNDSTISNESEYFISDIEFTDAGLGARFDMLALRWLAAQRRNGSTCRAALSEVKYGDGALGGGAGLLKHLRDIDALISNRSRYADLLRTMEAQFNQLDYLGLLNFNRCKNGTKVMLAVNDKPEVVFVLANHNPRSSKLKTILNDPEIEVYDQSANYDLRFYVSRFAGYGLHADCMLNLADFRKLQ